MASKCMIVLNHYDYCPYNTNECITLKMLAGTNKSE